MPHSKAETLSASSQEQVRILNNSAPLPLFSLGHRKQTREVNQNQILLKGLVSNIWCLSQNNFKGMAVSWLTQKCSCSSSNSLWRNATPHFHLLPCYTETNLLPTSGWLVKAKLNIYVSDGSDEHCHSFISTDTLMGMGYNQRARYWCHPRGTKLCVSKSTSFGEPRHFPPIKDTLFLTHKD